MTDNNTNFQAGHRQRLRQKFLDGNLAEYELLELLLSFVIPRRDVRILARGLIQKFGGLHHIFTAPVDELIKYPGIGQNCAVFLKAVQQAMLCAYKSNLTESPIFHDNATLTNYCRMLLAGKTVEEFHVLYLDKEMRLIKDEQHSVGSVAQSAVYPREIVKQALALNARNIVLLHNHPTPQTSFSDADVKVTQLLKNILEPIDIKLHDHYVISDGILYSARAMFLIS